MVFVSSVMESVTGEPIELSGDKKCAITMFTPKFLQITQTLCENV